METSASIVKSSPGLKLSKYAAIAQVYFFFNALLLPKGMLYTNVLSPFFYWHVLKRKLNTFWKPFFLFLCLFDLLHLYFGVEIKSFLFLTDFLFPPTSVLFLFTIFLISTQTSKKYLNKLFL